MKYVKLTAKKDTWFKEGTEVYHYDSDENNKFRISLDEWKAMTDDSIGWGVLVRGTWIAVKGVGAVENCGYVEGREYFDGELCDIEEFEIEIVDEKY